jgi:hypothetical protein
MSIENTPLIDDSPNFYLEGFPSGGVPEGNSFANI